MYLTLLFTNNANNAGGVCLMDSYKIPVFSWELFLELQAALSQKGETFPSAWSRKW